MEIPSPMTFKDNFDHGEIIDDYLANLLLGIKQNTFDVYAD